MDNDILDNLQKISMTTEQALKHMRIHFRQSAECFKIAQAKGYHRAAAGHLRDMAAEYAAITALEEKAERENNRTMTMEGAKNGKENAEIYRMAGRQRLGL